MVGKEDEVRSPEQRIEWIEAAIDGAEIALWDQKLATDHVVRSGRWASMLGYEPEEIEQTTGGWRALIHPEDLPAVDRIREEHEQGRIPLFRVEHRMRAKNGEWRWILNWGRIVERDADGKALRAAGIHLDITSRKRAEAALAESEERFREFAALLPQAVFEVDDGEEITYVNRHGLECIGYASTDAVHGRHFGELVVPEDRERLHGALARCGTLPDHNLGEFAILRKDSSVCPALFYARSIVRDDRRVWLLVVVDISERKRVEAELARADKLESVGTLAGGIAHDFNNLLATILGNISLARMDLDPHSPVATQLEQAANATLRARDLTQQLLTFARGGAPVREAAHIAEIVRESARFALHGSNVDCELVIPSDLQPADVAVGQISQVLNNLLINADQAMPGGGTIRLVCRNRQVQMGTRLAVPAGDYVEISVQDQGVGIPVRDLHRIFDPFFSTKPGGNGLGLASAYSIVRNHGGCIEVDSKEGKGTRFTVLLPAARTDPEDGATIAELGGGAEGRLLVVDDDLAILDMVSELTSRLGYESKGVTDGKAALQAFRRAQEEGEPFDAVLLDLTIPGGMGGLETLRALRSMDPDVRAIVSSGYSNDPVLADHRRYGFSARLAKPYRVEDLGECLRLVFAPARPNRERPSAKSTEPRRS